MMPISKEEWEQHPLTQKLVRSLEGVGMVLDMAKELADPEEILAFVVSKNVPGDVENNAPGTEF